MATEVWRLAKYINEYGFDRSYQTEDGSIAIRCSQCESLAISGTPAHEHGCPNQTFECKGCNARVSRRGAYCEDCR